VSKTNIRAVVLDAFGTVCHISDRRSPFRKIARSAIDREETGRIAMTRPLGLFAFAREINALDHIDQLAALERSLHEELLSIRLYPEVSAVLHELKRRGYKLAIASNLAQPYAVPVRHLLPFELDAYAWSFDVGAIKPDPEIYRWVGDALGCAACEMLMVGDTSEADFKGASACGLHSLHVDRANTPSVRGSIATLEGILSWLEE
jgi:HAD superfamily hydrolase (TIGR01549 family)